MEISEARVESNAWVLVLLRIPCGQRQRDSTDGTAENHLSMLGSSSNYFSYCWCHPKGKMQRVPAEPAAFRTAFSMRTPSGRETEVVRGEVVR